MSWLENKLRFFDRFFRKEPYVESVEFWNTSRYTFLPYLYMPKDQVGKRRKKTESELRFGHVDYQKMFPTW
jgi:hypothetical protein